MEKEEPKSIDFGLEYYIYDINIRRCRICTSQPWSGKRWIRSDSYVFLFRVCSLLYSEPSGALFQLMR